MTPDIVERCARAAFKAHHATGPTETAYDEPNWGRGGFKTEVIVWEAVALACLEASGMAQEIERLRDIVRRAFDDTPGWVEDAAAALRAKEQSDG